MENITRNLFIVAAIVALIVFPLLYFGGIRLFGISISKPEPPPLIWGVTFSDYYAQDVLGLDWQETYRAILDELKVKYLRIPVYWTEVEPEKGQFNFSAYDWMLDLAATHSAKVVLVVGQKMPRWPECFVPQWAQDLNPKEREEQLLGYIRNTVERYKNLPAVEAWQVENEPFFNMFGSCPKLNQGALNREIKLVRSLDGKPVVISDSGEWGFWWGAARRSDIFGSTLYRQVWSPLLGHFTHIFPPFYYRFKAGWIKSLTAKHKFWVVELQAEPWSKVTLPDTSLEEQLKLMNRDVFVKYMKFANSVDFQRNYLWGAEWWYWLVKKHGNFEMWDIAKKLFIEGYDKLVQ